ncbi:MAG: hypothetical protein GX589_01350 [Deltaproteobacteria bacterium]|nr:hypothetical protein [Deltaproteobacteria bacterium]
MSLPTIVGHEIQRRRLKHLLHAGKLPTALIFAGIPGIGKVLAAKELIRTLFCEQQAQPETAPYGGCGSCRNCQIFDAGNQPDFYLIDCLDKETWNIESLRGLLYSLNLRAFSGASRVVLINNAEHLSLQAANALLKALEEPRPSTHFFLVTSNCSRLPRTLVSRCQVWFFDALKPSEIALILQSQTDTSAALSGPIEEIAFLADGTMDNIGAISSNLSDWRDLQKTLEGIFKGDIDTAQSAALQLSRDRDSLRDKLKLMRIYARQRMRETEDRSRRSRWAACVANLLESERFIFERNLNAQYLLSSLFLSLAAHPGLETFTTLTNSDTLLSRHFE